MIKTEESKKAHSIEKTKAYELEKTKQEGIERRLNMDKQKEINK